MGIFSSKKKIYVSAVAYNLAGDESDRVDFVKYSVLNSVMQNQSISNTLVRGIINGQGMHIKTAHSYAKDEYTYGVPNSNFLGTGSVDPAVLSPILSVLHSGFGISILTSYISPADYEFWAEQHLAEAYGYDRMSGIFDNPPAGADADADVSYDYISGKLHFVLMNANATTVQFDFTPSAFLSGRMYVHATYKTIKTHSPTSVTTVRAAEVGEVDSVTNVFSSTTIADEVSEKNVRTTVVITGGSAHVTVLITESIVSRSKYYTYLLNYGSHPTLDALLTIDPVSVPFYPAVPLRVNNVDMTNEAHQDTPLYETSKKLLKKCGIKINDLADRLNDNDNIADIDFAFVVFGVSLRSQTKAGKRYLYQFMEHLQGLSTVTKAQFDAWNALPAFKKKKTAPPTNNLLLYDSQNRENNYDTKLQWQFISTELVAGTIHSGARPGDVDISMGGQQLHELQQSTDYTDMMVDTSALYLRRQIDEDTFELMEVNGLYFSNFIYKGKAVEMSAFEAWNEEDEEVGDSFIIPLNRDIFKGLGGRWMTQLGQECVFLVLNCYKVVKQKWYQTGWFKILLVILSIVIMVLFPPAGGLFGAIAGALFGTAIGLSLIATIITATLTVLASMIVMNLLSPLLVDAFGEKWGRILAVVVAIAVGGGFGQQGVFANLMSLSAPQLLLQVGQVAGQLYGAYVQGEMVGMAVEMAEATTKYKAEMKTIEELTKELLGSNNVLNLEGYLDAAATQISEGASAFLARTLLTGSEIVEITNGIITDFADFSLDLRSSIG